VDPSSFFFSPRHPNGHVETKRRRTFAQQQSRNIKRGTRSYPNRRCIVSWTTFTNQNKNVLQRRIFFRTNVIESTNILHTQFITSPFTTRPPPCEIQCGIKMSKRKINTTIGDDPRNAIDPQRETVAGPFTFNRLTLKRISQVNQFSNPPKIKGKMLLPASLAWLLRRWLVWRTWQIQPAVKNKIS
jgi:hypothetical protein